MIQIVLNFLNLVYQNGMIPTINTPTRDTRKTATAIGHILPNRFTETVFKTAIFKSDIYLHFPICFLAPSSSTQTKNETSFIYRRILNTESTQPVKKKYDTDSEETETSKTPNEAYTTFLQKFIVLYDNFFSKKRLNRKQKI